MHPEIELARRNAERDLREGLAQEGELIADYIEGYEFRGEGADHIPTEDERVLLIDAVAGLLGDEKLRALVAQNESRRELLEGLPVNPDGSRVMPLTGCSMEVTMLIRFVPAQELRS